MAPPVAIVTGGSSGIGLALVQHLVSLAWNVVIADVRPLEDPLPYTQYISTDITSWDQQAKMFDEAYRWHGRLDFCALNAGIDDRDDVFSVLSYDFGKPPRKPNMQTFKVNVMGTYYGVKLAAHYMTVPSLEAGKLKPGGKIVITASGGGIFPIPALPQYTATKHALIGLVRALGASKAPLKANVRINALCPAIVSTSLVPAALREKLQPAQITPMATMVRCFNALADLDNARHEDWVEFGPTGQTLEGTMEDLIWHQTPERPTPNEAARKMMEEVGLAAAMAYGERNRAYAMEER